MNSSLPLLGDKLLLSFLCLKFCLSPSKEKKDLFVLKQKDIFLFCFAVATNLIERLEIALFSMYSTFKSRSRLISTFSSIQNQIVEIVL